MTGITLGDTGLSRKTLAKFPLHTSPGSSRVDWNSGLLSNVVWATEVSGLERLIFIPVWLE